MYEIPQITNSELPSAEGMFDYCTIIFVPIIHILLFLIKLIKCTIFGKFSGNWNQSVLSQNNLNFILNCL